MIIADYPQNVVAYITEDEIFPEGRSEAGDKDAHKGVYKIRLIEINFPILVVEEDIVNADGFGLLRGFYEVRPDKDLDFLCLLQSGKIKAKLPILKVGRVEDNPKPKEKISEAKKKKKYKLGKSPDDYIHKRAELFYDNKNNCYILIYEFQNTKILGVMKVAR